MRRGGWFGFGTATGLVLAWGAHEVAFISWRAAVAPIDQRPMVIRQDAKGDGRFGAPRSGDRIHQGVDLEAPLGTSVRAIRSGKVVTVGFHRGLGQFVRVAHAGRLESLYGHLQTVAVLAGERVRQGQVIGTVGKTGNARHRLISAHVHLEVHRAGEPIDPTTLGLVFVDRADGLEDRAEATGGS